MLSCCGLYAKHLARGRSPGGRVSEHVPKPQIVNVGIRWQGVQIKVQRCGSHISRIAEPVKEQTQDVVQLILIPALVLLRGQR